MKKLITMACSVALLNIFSLAHAQTQDSALAKVDLKENSSNAQVTEMPKSPVESDNTMTTTSKTVTPINNFILEEKDDKHSILENKVGPMGEDLLMKNKKFYYFDQNGKKIRVKNSQLQDKPKHS